MSEGLAGSRVLEETGSTFLERMHAQKLKGFLSISEIMLFNYTYDQLLAGSSSYLESPEADRSTLAEYLVEAGESIWIPYKTSSAIHPDNGNVFFVHSRAGHWEGMSRAEPDDEWSKATGGSTLNSQRRDFGFVAASLATSFDEKNGVVVQATAPDDLRMLVLEVGSFSAYESPFELVVDEPQIRFG